MHTILKRTLFLVLLTFLVLGGIYASSDSSTNYAYKELSKKEKSLYKKMDTAVEKLEDTIKDVALDEESVKRVYSAYLSDHPGVFWVGGTFSYTSLPGDKDTVDVLRLSFTHTDTLSKDKKQFKKIISDFHSVIKKEKDDWAKLYYIYTYLATRIHYDKSHMDQSIWSVFTDGIGVCAGFAKAFQYLALNENIPCIVVTGNKLDSKGRKSDEGHMWCMAKIDGKWYHFDPTWALSENIQNVDYSYFCRSEEVMKRTHVIDNVVPVPKAKNDNLSYSQKRGRYFESYNENKINDAVSEAIRNHESSFTLEFSSARDAEKAKVYLVDKSGLSPLLPKGSGAVRFQYSLNEQNYTLRLIFQ